MKILFYSGTVSLFFVKKGTVDILTVFKLLLTSINYVLKLK